MNRAVEHQLRLCPRLPTLSGVAIELVTAARDPDVELGDITRLINTDPALAARMLRIANSSLYQQFREVQNLDQAVRVLGLNATIALSLNFSLAACLRECRAPGIDLDHFWRRALISAMAARLLGQYHAVHELDELFLAALLQDIGRLALDAALPGQYAATQDIECDPHVGLVYECEAIGTDHIEAGAWLAEEWRLPEYLSLAISGSHDQRQRNDLEADVQRFIGCVAVSGRVADIVLVADGDRATEQAKRVAHGCLDLQPAALGGIIDQLVDTMPEVESLFDTSVLTVAQADGLTEKAQELITCRNLRRLDAVAEWPENASEFKQIADQLYEVAHRDALTGLFNRRHFDETLEAAFAEAGGQRQPLSVAYVDLDYFKTINDEHGHIAGDAVLQTIATAIQGHLRPRDLVARYGGEEFVILLPGIDSSESYALIERLRLGIANLATEIDDTTRLSTTLSAGVATYHSDESHHASPTDLMKAADQALYKAKNAGRNTVVVAE